MKKKIRLSIVIVLLGGMLFGGIKTSAIDASRMGSMMTISPPRERMILTPGEDYEGAVVISSSANATKDLEYSVHVGSFGLKEDENGNTDYNYTDVETITGYNQIMDWIVLGKEKGSISPGSSDTLPYTIKVPKEAPAGGQYASIIIRNDTKKDNDGGNVAIENVVEFAVGIFAEVTGETVDKGTILENNIPSFVLNNQLSATSLVKNDGNTHTDAEYILQLWPLFGDEEIYTNEEEPETSMVMPGTERYHAKTVTTPSFGIFRAKQTVKIFGETSIVEKIVIVCPLWLLFLILFVIIALILWIIMKVKGNKKRKSNTTE